MRKKIVAGVKEFYLTFSVMLAGIIEARALAIVLIFGIACVLSPDTASAFDGQRFEQVCSKTLEMMHGGFGALLMATAGVGAVVASAAGGFRIAWALVVVAVGAFTLKEYQELWTSPCGGE
jgi:hypothetical protein